VAVIVVNYNMPERADAIAEYLAKTATHDLYLLIMPDHATSEAQNVF
jgi:hypothetical protein